MYHAGQRELQDRFESRTLADLFLRIGDKPGRLRINGVAEIAFEGAMLAEFPGAQALTLQVRNGSGSPPCGRQAAEAGETQ